MLSNDREISKALPHSGMTEKSLEVNLDIHHINLQTAIGVLRDPKNDVIKVTSVQKLLPSTKKTFVAHEQHPDDQKNRYKLV